MNIDEEVTLQDVLPFFVLLGLFVRFVLPQSKEEIVVSREAIGSEKEKWMLTYFQPSMVPHLQQ